MTHEWAGVVYFNIYIYRHPISVLSVSTTLTCGNEPCKTSSAASGHTNHPRAVNSRRFLENAWKRSGES